MENRPLVSIVILTKNGGETLLRSIESIFSQRCDFNFEVIAVDSGTTEKTLDMLKNYPVKVVKIRLEDFSFGPTRDFAFSKTSGEYIVTLSQDVIPVSDRWLEYLVTPLTEDVADIVQGHTILPQGDNFFLWERKKLFYFTQEGRDFVVKYGGISLSCTNLAMKRGVWEKIKFGNAPMNEDKAFQKKAFLAGHRILVAKKATAFHGHQYSLKSLIKRCENEGFGWKYVGVRYPFSKLVADLTQRWIYGVWIRALLKREIKNFAEFLFIFIRPLFLFKGNIFNRSYKF